MDERSCQKETGATIFATKLYQKGSKVSHHWGQKKKSNFFGTILSKYVILLISVYFARPIPPFLSQLLFQRDRRRGSSCYVTPLEIRCRRGGLINFEKRLQKRVYHRPLNTLK